MTNSITYPAVTGPREDGQVITLNVGDEVTGRTPAGDLVTGKVVATHGHYPSVTVEGIGTQAFVAGRWDLHLDRVIWHRQALVKVGQR